MAVSDADFKALQDRVARLEADDTGGWAPVVTGAWKKVEPYVTPILVAASAAAVLWINSLNHARTAAKVDDVRAATEANAAKVDQAAAAVRATEEQSKKTSDLLVETHQETREAIRDVKAAADDAKAAADGAKREAARPRPFLPPPDPAPVWM